MLLAAGTQEVATLVQRAMTTQKYNFISIAAAAEARPARNCVTTITGRTYIRLKPYTRFSLFLEDLTNAILQFQRIRIPFSAHFLSVPDGDGRLAEEPDHVPDEGQHVALVLSLRLDPATKLLNTLNETEVRWITI